MFSKTLVFAIAAVLVSAVVSAEKKLGEGVTLKEATPIATLLETPEEYVGRTVRVDGTVTGVCTSMGCWLELVDVKDGKPLQFKVEDGVIVFPISAKGRRASAEGTFERVAGDKKKYRVKATGAVIQ